MKCTVCGKRFKPKKEDRYEGYYIDKPLLGSPQTITKDCFDCPQCGCQIAAGTRLEKIIEITEKSDETT